MFREFKSYSTVVVLSGAIFAAFSQGVQAAQVATFDLFRNAEYQQTSGSGTPGLLGYFFTARTFLNTPGFNSNVVTYPGPGSPATASQVSPTFFLVSSPFLATKSSLDTAYPTGIYTSKSTNTATMATETYSINYSSDQYSSAIPTLTSSSFNALQSYNPSTSLTLNWNTLPVASAPVNEQDVFFNIFRVSDGTNVFSSSFLPASTTSIVIPANTLAVNTDYFQEIDFSNRINAVDTSGTGLIQGFDVRTSTNFRTTSTSVPEPSEVLGVLALGCVGLVSRFKRQSKNQTNAN